MSNPLEDLEVITSIIKTANSTLYDELAERLCNVEKELKNKICLRHINNTKVRVPFCALINGKTTEERFATVEHIYYSWEELKEALEDKISSLEKEVGSLKEELCKVKNFSGCPTEVLAKALEKGIYCDRLPSCDRMEHYPKLSLTKVEDQYFLKYKDTMCVSVKDYKILWWLKLDKSE